MTTGDIFEDEREKIKDPHTGREYTRLTKTSRNKHLYLYVNTFDTRGRLVFVSERDGYLNYYRMDLETGQAMQLTRETEIAAAGLAWHSPRHNKLVYWAGRSIRLLDTDSLECMTVVDYPRFGGYLTLTSDGKHILTYYDTGTKADTPDGNKARVGPWEIFSIPVDDPACIETPSGNSVVRTRCFVNHIQASPTDPDLVEYCWEGEWHPQRMWSTNLAGTRGGPFGLQMPNERRGHEFWFSDGTKMGYHGTVTRNGQRRAIIGTVTSNGNNDWQLEVEEHLGHCMYHRGRDMWVTDRAGEDNALAIIHNDDGKGRLERLCHHNSSWKSQGCHPHMQFSPNGERLVWTTDGEGVSQVYMMEV